MMLCMKTLRLLLFEICQMATTCKVWPPSLTHIPRLLARRFSYDPEGWDGERPDWEDDSFFTNLMGEFGAHQPYDCCQVDCAPVLLSPSSYKTLPCWFVSPFPSCMLCNSHLK